MISFVIDHVASALFVTAVVQIIGGAVSAGAGCYSMFGSKHLSEIGRELAIIFGAFFVFAGVFLVIAALPTLISPRDMAIQYLVDRVW